MVRAMVKATSVSGPAPAGPCFETTISACGGGGVLVTTVLESFSEFGSVAQLTMAILVNVVPGGVARGMLKTRVKVAEAPRRID